MARVSRDRREVKPPVSGDRSVSIVVLDVQPAEETLLLEATRRGVRVPLVRSVMTAVALTRHRVRPPRRDSVAMARQSARVVGPGLVPAGGARAVARVTVSVDGPPGQTARLRVVRLAVPRLREVIVTETLDGGTGRGSPLVLDLAGAASVRHFVDVRSAPTMEGAASSFVPMVGKGVLLFGMTGLRRALMIARWVVRLRGNVRDPIAVVPVRLVEKGSLGGVVRSPVVRLGVKALPSVVAMARRRVRLESPVRNRPRSCRRRRNFGRTQAGRVTTSS